MEDNICYVILNNEDYFSVCVFRYDRQRLVLKEIHNCQYVTCMNPTAGSFSVNPRLQVTHTQLQFTSYICWTASFCSSTFFFLFLSISTWPLLLSVQRHFSVFAVHFPGAEALNTIYSSILCGHFQQGRFSYGVSRSVGALVQASVCLHQKMTQNFLPTAIRFHYIFNLRDLSNIFQVCVSVSL